MAKKLLFLGFLFIIISSAAQNNTHAVFVAGADLYQSYRIPAMVTLKDGSIIAFAEGRVNNAGDFGDVDIVMKKSNDKGVSWSQLSTIVNYEKLQAGNPAPVVDLTDPKFPNGRIFLFYNTGNAHENELRMGMGLREVWYITSTDGGAKWSRPVNITLQVHKPYQTNKNPAYHFAEQWRSYANTPGHAIQFKQGKYKGRIYVIGNHSAGYPQKNFADYDVHGFYTDDHGASFHLSNNLNLPGSNEAMAVELSDNRLMINARNQSGTPRNRIVALSSDGGVSWDTSFYDLQLIDPVCQGSIVDVYVNNKKAIIFCNNKDANNRDHLTLRISYDEGKTWSKTWMIAESKPGFRGDYTGYSDLIPIDNKSIGVLYELNNYQQIAFSIFDLR